MWANNSYEYLSACAELELYKDKRLDNYIDYIAKDMTSFADVTNDLGTCKFPLMLRALVMMGYHERNMMTP